MNDNCFRGAQNLTFNGGTGDLTFETALTSPNFIHINNAKDVSFNSILQTPGDLLQSAGTGTTRFFDSVNASAIHVTTGEITLSGNGNLNAGSGAGAISLTAQTGAVTGGDILVDSAHDLTLGIVNANSNGDKLIGNVNTFSRSGVTTDANGKDLNITANKLVMISSGNIGSKLDPIELSSKTQINKPAYTSFPACSNAADCESDRFVKDAKEAKEPKQPKEAKVDKDPKPKK